MQDKKDFEYQFTLEANTEPLINFKNSELIKNLLFEEFKKTDLIPDSYKYTLRITNGNEDLYHKLWDKIKEDEDTCIISPTRDIIGDLEKECQNKHNNKTLEKEYYSHSLKDTETYKLIKNLYSDYESIINGSKDVLTTNEYLQDYYNSVCLDIEHLSESVQIELLVFFRDYDKNKNVVTNAFDILTLYKEDKKNEYENLITRLKGRFNKKIKELSSEVVEEKYFQIATKLKELGRFEDIKPKVIENIIKHQKVPDESNKVYWKGSGTDLGNDMAYLWKIDVDKLVVNDLNKCFVIGKKKARKVTKGDIQNARGYLMKDGNKDISPFKNMSL